MSRTYRSIWKEFNWYNEAPKAFRKPENKAFRAKQKQFNLKYPEPLKRSKFRQYYW